MNCIVFARIRFTSVSVTMIKYTYAPDSETLLMPIFFPHVFEHLRQLSCTTWIGLPEHYIRVIWNFWGSKIELCCCAQYAQICLWVEAMQEALSTQRTMWACVVRRVFKNKMSALNVVSGKKRFIKFPCLFIPWHTSNEHYSFLN